MKYTGERLTTEFETSFGTNEHLSRYVFATLFVKGKNVLDAACGEGYGTNILSKYAHDIIGVDIDNDTIEHARNKYAKNNIKFIQSDIINIPLETNSRDCIVCFETIEHTMEQNATIMEFKRILKNDGMLLISSPSRKNYQKRDPNNKFHLKELSDDEFLELLGKSFKYIELYKQYFITGSFIRAMSQPVCLHREFSGDFCDITNHLRNEDRYYNIDFFNIIVASDVNIEELNTNSIFDGSKVVKELIEKKIETRKNSLRLRTLDFLSFPLFALKKIYNILIQKFR